MTRIGLARFVLSAGCAAVVLAGGAATAATSAIGDDGDVLRVVAGSYGELFADGADADAENEVLALEIRAADGIVERLLVPETFSPAGERAPALVYEHATKTAYLLWQSTLGLIHSVLHLTSFDGEAWGPVFEISGNPFTRKLSPQLRVTRDSYKGSDGEAIHRTAIHVAWGEETAGGTIKHWTPILIEDGRHLSWMPTWNLSDFLPSSDAAGADSYTALRLEAGWKDNNVLLGFTDTYAARIGVVDVEILPGELETLADWARWSVIHDGAEYDDPGDLAQAIHDSILELGDGFHPATLQYLADQIRALIQTAPEPLSPAGLADIADQARWSVIHDGAVVGSNGLADDDPFTILEVDRPDDAESHHLLKVTVRSLRDAPVGIGAEPKLYVSDHGTDVIVAWQGEGAVHYVESVEDGWSETRTLVLGDSLDAAGVESMLEARVASR